MPDSRASIFWTSSQQVEPVGVRETEIEDDERGLLLVELHARFRSGPRVRDDEVGVPQIERDQLSHRGIVLDHHDACGHGANARGGASANL